MEPVPDYLARAVVAALICPVAGIVSLYFSVWTNRSLVAGDYFGAREHSRLARAWANAALWLVLAAALFFGLVTLLDAVGNP